MRKTWTILKHIKLKTWPVLAYIQLWSHNHEQTFPLPVPKFSLLHYSQTTTNCFQSWHINFHFYNLYICSYNTHFTCFFTQIIILRFMLHELLSIFHCVVQFSYSVMSYSATPWTATRQASLSITNSWSLLKLKSIELVIPSNYLILVVPFSCFQSFPASGFFPMSQFFLSGSQSIGISASTSVLPKNIQDWFPWGLTGLISLQSEGLSRVFSNTTVQKHQFFGTQLSL